jgi:hypothetical protein
VSPGIRRRSTASRPLNPRSSAPRADAVVFEQAKAKATEIETAEVDTEAEAKRAAAMKQAVELAGKIRTAARGIDQIAEEFSRLAR